MGVWVWESFCVSGVELTDSTARHLINRLFSQLQTSISLFQMYIEYSSLALCHHIFSCVSHLTVLLPLCSDIRV
jgi:hypothetical protein